MCFDGFPILQSNKIRQLHTVQDVESIAFSTSDYERAW
jgi:hypothetical protein